ncbi:MAG TPA: 50S ribosomal protein L11 methyltransferase [Patescibacteria group bacterium]|nr:50S ribosomal protein L11 methyltransferase [Patescibacteria group bacterium]
MATSDLYNIIVSLPAALDDSAVGHYAPALDERALARSAMREGNVHTADWTITWLVEGAPDKAELAEIFDNDNWRVEKVADVNWLEHSYKQFEPFSVGEFFVYGSHFDGEPPLGQIPLLIDAATAFGSGEHGTTAGCLRALLALQEARIKPRRILDMGTGSGILAVAAVKLWSVPALAVDIDPESVIVAARHAKMNGTGTAINSVQGDGFRTPQVEERAPFDLIIANILAGPLVQMAPDLCDVLAPGGHVILSGMLAEQTPEVQVMYEKQGCRARRQFHQAGWTALLLVKRGP